MTERGLSAIPATAAAGILGPMLQRDRPLIRAFRRAIVCAFLVALQACGGGGGGGGGAPDATATETIGSVTTASITSTQSGYSYPLSIYLPASYATGAARYPVIYATDGDASYPPGGRFDNFKKILQRRGTNAILVGIGGSVRRGTDYVLPGALGYHAFLTLELIPYIEARLRADPQRRVLSGLSFGGSFVGIALFIEAPKTLFFSHYLAAEGSFWQQDVLDLEQQLSNSIGSRAIPAMLILARSTGVEFPGGTNYASVNALYRKMADRRYAGLQLAETVFKADHVGVDNPSFEDAVIRIFE